MFKKSYKLHLACSLYNLMQLALDLLLQVMVLSDSLPTVGLRDLEQYTTVTLDTIWLVLLLVHVSPVDPGVDHPLIVKVIIVYLHFQICIIRNG